MSRENAMKFTVVGLMVLLTTVPALGQRPSDPALVVPQDAPRLDYVAVAEPLTLPADVTMGAPASVAFDSRGHLYLVNRGPQPVMEFDPDGRFVRSLGEGLFVLTHGIDVDRDGNVWVTDVG